MSLIVCLSRRRLTAWSQGNQSTTTLSQRSHYSKKQTCSNQLADRAWNKTTTRCVCLNCRHIGKTRGMRTQSVTTRIFFQMCLHVSTDAKSQRTSSTEKSIDWMQSHCATSHLKGNPSLTSKHRHKMFNLKSFQSTTSLPERTLFEKFWSRQKRSKRRKVITKS